jgi:hypothetical protein
VSEASTVAAVRAAGGPIEEIVAIYMLHPETFEQTTKNGYEHPLAGYFAGRSGVLGDATADVVSSIMVFFEPSVVRGFWEQGLPVHGGLGGAKIYYEQAAEFARKYLTGVEGLDRLVELGEKVIESAPAQGFPLFAGWRAMPRASDTPARAFQVLFVLRELRGSVHNDAFAVSGLTPIEAHMLNRGKDYCAFFGWQEPFASGEDKRSAYEAAEDTTNRRMAEIVGSALSAEEADELAQLASAALETVKAAATPDEASS